MSNIKKAFEEGKGFYRLYYLWRSGSGNNEPGLIRAAAENGADLIELGIPFSDPTAEGSGHSGVQI